MPGNNAFQADPTMGAIGNLQRRDVLRAAGAAGLMMAGVGRSFAADPAAASWPGRPVLKWKP